MSEFWSTVLEWGERDTPEFDDLESQIDEIKDAAQNLMDDTQGKFDNLPEGFQQGDTGQLLEERVNALQDCIDNLDGISIDGDFDEGLNENELAEAKQQRAEEVWSEVSDAVSISCS